MNRPGAASLHWRTRSGDPFKAPITLWRSIMAMVCSMSSRSVRGDQTGLGHGGCFSRAAIFSCHGLFGSPSGSSASIGTQRATGGGPVASAATACRCMSMISGRSCFACDHASCPGRRSRITRGRRVGAMPFFMLLSFCSGMGLVLLGAVAILLRV
jgi:hypothetical protein